MGGYLWLYGFPFSDIETMAKLQHNSTDIEKWKQIYDPPPVLYIKGSLTREDNLAISIVGSRRFS